MDEKSIGFKERLRRITLKILKATIKAALLYGVYFVLSMFLAPISDVVPGFQQMVETFVTVYLFLMILGEITSGTVFQHFFGAAKALFVILYLIFSLNGGVITLYFQGAQLMVDIRLFLMVAILLSLLGFAKSVLQAISFLNEKAQMESLKF
ncbi:hypothetical protein DRO45_01090 [Candidatus Bathyarchaeota archaeon]|nr:MAG: hypothetical protein DRO45_01090 [Candidatus Bathyarchaeota archaeon]HDN05691.1 hypothetical protein [Candidatus Bathyarchaeota archaeon]